MGGELRFDSNPDQGTLATLVLPVAKGLTIQVDKMLKHAT